MRSAGLDLCKAWACQIIFIHSQMEGGEDGGGTVVVVVVILFELETGEGVQVFMYCIIAVARKKEKASIRRLVVMMCRSCLC